MIQRLVENKKISKYRLAKKCGIPYTTVNDICSGKAQVEKCSAITIYRIAKELGVTMESILESYVEERGDFEIFKSNTCHRVKELGDVDFIIEILEDDTIGRYYRRKWYRESLYLLAMLDYLSRENDIPYCSLHDDLRCMKLKDPVFPYSVLVASEVARDDEPKIKSIIDSIPEFIRFNIVESEVRNVI